MAACAIRVRSARIFLYPGYRNHVYFFECYPDGGRGVMVETATICEYREKEYYVWACRNSDDRI
jgi:hypothetical protein